MKAPGRHLPILGPKGGESQMSWHCAALHWLQLSQSSPTNDQSCSSKALRSGQAACQPPELLLNSCRGEKQCWQGAGIGTQGRTDLTSLQLHNQGEGVRLHEGKQQGRQSLSGVVHPRGSDTGGWLSSFLSLQPQIVQALALSSCWWK